MDRSTKKISRSILRSFLKKWREKIHNSVLIAEIRCAGNHGRLGGSRKPKLLVLSSWGTGTWIQLLYFIAFSARVRLLHARPVLQSDFNASLIISDLTRGAPPSLFHVSGANGGDCVTYVWGNLVTNLISKYRFLPPRLAPRSIEFSGFSLFTKREGGWPCSSTWNSVDERVRSGLNSKIFFLPFFIDEFKER